MKKTECNSEPRQSLASRLLVTPRRFSVAVNSAGVVGMTIMIVIVGTMIGMTEIGDSVPGAAVKRMSIFN